jgi:hypothetical protein
VTHVAALVLGALVGAAVMFWLLTSTRIAP